ncbi:MAG: cytochrome c [Nitrospinae bacterium]|nr:cytochrome c [Nitrospinota bacterium]
MVTRNRWMGSSLGLLWVWGWLLGNIAFGGVAEPGKEVYQKRCLPCHGADGKGNPQMAEALKTEIQDLSAPALLSKPETELLKAIADGKGKMPPFGKVLNEQDQRAVLSYIRQLTTGAR